MDRQDPHQTFSSYFVVLLTMLGYILVFSFYRHQVGIGLASLAILPVMVASWFFGIGGGMITAVIAILSNTFILTLDDYSVYDLYKVPGNVIGTFSLFVVALMFGNLTKVIHERKRAMLKLEQYE